MHRPSWYGSPANEEGWRTNPLARTRGKAVPAVASTRAMAASAAAPLRVLIGYHFPCPDGASAAVAATLGLLVRAGKPLDVAAPLAAQLGADVAFLPLPVYETAAVRIERLRALVAARGGRVGTLYLLDFSGGVEFLRAAAALADELLLLDHHATAREDLDGATATGTLPLNLRPTVVMDHCGTTITAAHFGLLDDSGAALARLYAAHPAGGAAVAARLVRLFTYVEDVA